MDWNSKLNIYVHIQSLAGGILLFINKWHFVHGRTLHCHHHHHHHHHFVSSQVYKLQPYRDEVVHYLQQPFLLATQK